MGGDLVQRVLLIAGFAITAILFITWIATALLNKDADTAACIESAYGASASCAPTHAEANSFKKDSDYVSRYP